MMSPQNEFLDAVKRGDAQSVSDLLRGQPELIRFADEYAKTGLQEIPTKNTLSARARQRSTARSTCLIRFATKDWSNWELKEVPYAVSHLQQLWGEESN